MNAADLPFIVNRLSIDIGGIALAYAITIHIARESIRKTDPVQIDDRRRDKHDPLIRVWNRE